MADKVIGKGTGRPPSIESPPVRWVAFVDMLSIPELGRPLRYGAKVGDRVRLYYQARFAHPRIRYQSIHRWEPVSDADLAHELAAAMRAGYDVRALCESVERQRLASQRSSRRT